MIQQAPARVRTQVEPRYVDLLGLCVADRREQTIDVLGAPLHVGKQGAGVHQGA